MTENVLITIITSINGLVLAVVGIVGSVIMRRIGAVRAQVENTHDTNLRDDLDGKHDENRGVLLAIQRDLAWVMRGLADLRRDHDNLEDTLQPKGKNTR